MPPLWAQRNDSRGRPALGLLAGALEPAPSTNMERTFEFAEEGGLGITFVAHYRPAAAEHSSPRCAEEAAETAAAAAEQGDEASPTARSLVVVMAVLPGSMAARHEGLQPGMVLSSVQGEPVAGETFKPTMKLIKGAGRPVVLGFATVPAAPGDGTNGAPPRREAQLIPLGELAPPKPRRKKRVAHASSAPPPPAPPPPPPAPLLVLNADESEHETAVAAGARVEANEEAEEEQDEFGFAIGGYFSPRTHARALELSWRHLDATKRTRSRTQEKW